MKILAEYLDLSPATVSIVLNDSPVAKSISPATRQRVLAAAKKFAYRPNLHARMLRTRLTNTVGVIVPELSEGYFTNVMLGVEQSLLQEGYLYFTVSHLCRPDLIEEYPELLMNRAVDGFLLVNTELRHKVFVPVVGISSHSKTPGVTNVELDHNRATKMALRHLYELGHRRIAFMKGQRYSLDAEVRWQAIASIAQEVGITIRPELCIYLEKNSWSPELGYPPVRELLQRTRDFTAMFCFNDTAAIGAIRAIEDAGLNCPRDISVIGFDDIIVAEYYNPRLTTVRQPLHKMGWTAAQLLVKRIQSPDAPIPRLFPLNRNLSSASRPPASLKNQCAASASRTALHRLRQSDQSHELEQALDSGDPVAIWALGPVFVYFIVAGVATVMLGPLLPALISRWNIPGAQAGTLFTSSFAGQFLGAWFAARNLRASVVCGAALSAAGCVAMAWANFNVAHLALFCVGLGLGAGLLLEISPSELLVPPAVRAFCCCSMFPGALELLPAHCWCAHVPLA